MAQNSNLDNFVETGSNFNNRVKMKKVYCFFVLLAVIASVSVIVAVKNKEIRDFENGQTSFVYDFSYAELAIKYLETGNPEYLHEIANLNAADHLHNHALQSLLPGGSVGSKLELVTHFLSPIDEQRELLPIFKKNLVFAKESLAKSGIAEKIALKFLPADFSFSGSMFFTFGYNHVAHGENNSLNLAHPMFSDDMNEIIYVAIHELHHIGFIKLKDGYMPSLDITTYKEMLHKIEYATHLEGIATYAPFGAIEQDLKGMATDESFGKIEIERVSAMNFQKFYIVLQDLQLMQELETEFFDIYFHFKNEPDRLLTDEDWYKFQVLSYTKGLFYIVGAHMAKTIDNNLGREKLVNLISEPTENFIATYLELNRQ